VTWVTWRYRVPTRGMRLHSASSRTKNEVLREGDGLLEWNTPDIRLTRPCPTAPL
jgi:hypothetical protein